MRRLDRHNDAAAAVCMVDDDSTMRCGEAKIVDCEM